MLLAIIVLLIVFHRRWYYHPNRANLYYRRYSPYGPYWNGYVWNGYAWQPAAYGSGYGWQPGYGYPYGYSCYGRRYWW